MRVNLARRNTCVSEWVGFNGTSTQFRSLVPSLTRKADTESTTVKESRRYINLANAIQISRSPILPRCLSIQLRPLRDKWGGVTHTMINLWPGSRHPNGWTQAWNCTDDRIPCWPSGPRMKGFRRRVGICKFVEATCSRPRQIHHRLVFLCRRLSSALHVFVTICVYFMVSCD